ncbi:MAG: hypothetical protein WCF49_18065, partial [Xanthobacteraceae bacterium]
GLLRRHDASPSQYCSVKKSAALARDDQYLLREPEDSGPPVGYWALMRDPDGHTLEVAYGQELGHAVEDAA